MQFSDTSNNQGLIQDITFLTGANTTDYATSDRTRNINAWYYKVVLWIWKSCAGWEFDDSNLTTQPIATTTIVDGQRDYSVPTNALKIIAVDVKNSDGNYVRMKYLDEKRIKSSLQDEDASFPSHYYILGNQVILYPKPDSSLVTTSAGLRLWLGRQVDAFTAADTTQEPGFDIQFHRILSLGASYDWAIKKDKANAAAIRAEIEQLKDELFDWYGEKLTEQRTIIMPPRRNYE